MLKAATYPSTSIMWFLLEYFVHLY